MQVECISLSDEEEVALFWYEPSDVSPTTHVFGRWEGGMACGPCACLSFIFLANSVADFESVFTALRSGANDAPEGEDGDAYAQRQIGSFLDELRDLAARNGGSLAGVPGDTIRDLLTELDQHVFLATRGMAVSETGLEGHGTMVEYLAEAWNQRLALAMLALYCDDDAWQDAPGPDPAEVRARIEGKDALVVPGDEALVALAINLYNKGAYEECDVEDEPEGD